MSASRTRQQSRPSASPPRSADREPSPPTELGCGEAVGQNVLQPAVVATCWLDLAGDMEADPVLVRLSGRRDGVSGKPRPGDRFDVTETIGPLAAGCGPVSLTAKVTDVSAGEWLVWARPAPGRSAGARLLAGPPAGRSGPLRFLRAKGNPVRPGNTGTCVATRTGLLTTGPGLIPASWAPLVALGFTVALVVQAVLASRAHLSITASLGVSLAASVAGAAGARAWYVALNRGKTEGIPTQGLCVQGFIAASVIVLLAGLPLAGLPERAFLDLATPGLFFGMAIGRQGCFLHGCCTGRITGSRWGIWASDGRIGARRAPTQQAESLACLVIGLAALLLVLQARLPAGTVLAGALAAYTLARQLLFPYRAEPRRTSLGRRASLITALLVLIADVIVAVTA